MIHTIGHSTRTFEGFLELLQAHGVRQVADVRRVPRSSRHPQFAGDQLGAALATHGMAYRHFVELGGLRKARRDSLNTALRHESFRGYADHMQTGAFQAALLDLLQFAEAAPTALMCAEAVWWRCHRKLLSDILLVRGVQVRHILSTAPSKLHELSEFACVTPEGVTYPGLL